MSSIRKILLKRRKKLLKILIILLMLNIVFLYYLFMPKIKLNDIHEIISLNNNYSMEKPNAYRFGKKLNKKVIIEDKVDNTKIGNYYIKYTYNNGIYYITKYKRVTVIDDEKPIITLSGNNNVVVCSSKKYKEEGYTAYDNYDKDITNKVKITEEEDKIIYEVEDGSGNKTIKERTIIRSDIEKPHIKLKGNKIDYMKVNNRYIDSGYEVSDNCDNKKDLKVEITDNININKPGKYKRIYKVSDSSGNSNVVERTVIVINDKSKGVIYLTFDDGPSNQYTADILDILKKYNIKATFFVTMSGNDNLIKREYNEGHTVALHTASHNYKNIYSSVTSYFNDLNKIQNRVYRITGEKSKIIRFPGGSSNTVSKNYKDGIMTTLAKKVQEKGFVYVDWNISSGDAGETTNPKTEYKLVTKSLSKNRINVVLMHDIKKHTRDALESIIEYGINNNYSFEKITLETPVVHHRINN